MLLEVIHETRYEYAPPVGTAQHMAHLRPREMPGQEVVSHALAVTPTPARHRETVDLYGNTRAFFSLQSPHEELKIVARSVVRTRVHAPPEEAHAPVPWEHVRERFRYHAGAPFDAASEFVFASPYVPRHEDFLVYARPSFGAGTSLVAGATDLMHRIHADFTYESESTDVFTPPTEALEKRKGVCQDFAHVMIACLRVLGLPARYVSGYLLTEPPPGQPRLVGADASHAWASAYVPGAGWCDFDPTNDRAGWDSPGEDYVTLAIGRDYSDVSPVRGVLHGGGANHALHVGVTVQPLPSKEPRK
ncbi:MAG: transglutaminase family protein [Burkholderiaceae bacterium]